MQGIVCIDDHNGILFNHRRVSRDKVLMQWLMDYVNGSEVYLRPYSEELFDGYDHLHVSDSYLEEAGEKDFCFVEDDCMSRSPARFNKLLVCKWNRSYPSDVKLDVSLYETWNKEVLAEIPGSSHDKITIEMWWQA